MSTSTFQAAHESLMARLEREGKAEEITKLRAEKAVLVAMLQDIVDTFDQAGLRDSNPQLADERRVLVAARAALAKAEGGA